MPRSTCPHMARDTSDLKPVYLIISEHDMLVSQAVARLKTRVGEEADLDFNMQVFEGENASADEIVMACNTMPFASDKRLVIVRSIEKLGKEGLDALAAYAGDPTDTTVLALSGLKLAKNTRLYKAVDKLGGVVERKVGKRDVPALVKRMFEDRGKEIGLPAAEELVSVVGYDLRRLSAEVDKAIAYVGERKDVSLEDIKGVASTTAPASIFEFTEALGDRDCRRSLARAADLLGEGESVYALHAMALRTVRDLIAVRCLIDRGRGSLGEVMSELGRPDWQVKRLLRQARNFSAEELGALLRTAAAGEAKMKTSRDPRLVLERWIVQVCG